MFRKVKKLVKDEDENEKPEFSFNESNQLLEEINQKLQIIKSQDVKLELKHKKTKIMWK